MTEGTIFPRRLVKRMRVRAARHVYELEQMAEIDPSDATLVAIKEWREILAKLVEADK